MTYIDTEQSQESGQPVEVYKFIGSFKNYLYTSADRQLTVNGEIYTPIAVSRNAINAGTQEEDREFLELEMPFDTDVVLDYAYAPGPPDLSLEVRRVHRTSDLASQWVLFWIGKVTSFNVKNRIAQVRVPSIFQRALITDFPTIYWQNPCNHVLYDDRCGVVRASFTTTTSVVSFNNTIIEVVADGVADGALIGGELIITRTGERRTIVANQTDLVTVNFPFFDLQVNDAVDLSQGCDHIFTGDCSDTKFNNQVNFGGMPFIPGDNPFVGNL